MSTAVVRGNISRLFAIQGVYSPSIVATIVCAEQAFTVPGVLVGDLVLSVTKPTAQTTAPCTARVSAANTVMVTFVNPTAAGVTPTASQTYVFVIARPERGTEALPTVLTP
jgi:hypothetical protein